jgi:hypothetical protein
MADQKLQVIIKTVADTTGLTLTTEGAQKLQAALDGASKSTAKTGESQQKLGVSAKGASHELRGMAEAGRGGREVMDGLARASEGGISGIVGVGQAVRGFVNVLRGAIGASGPIGLAVVGLTAVAGSILLLTRHSEEASASVDELATANKHASDAAAQLEKARLTKLNNSIQDAVRSSKQLAENLIQTNALIDKLEQAKAAQQISAIDNNPRLGTYEKNIRKSQVQAQLSAAQRGRTEENLMAEETAAGTAVDVQIQAKVAEQVRLNELKKRQAAIEADRFARQHRISNLTSTRNEAAILGIYGSVGAAGEAFALNDQLTDEKARAEPGASDNAQRRAADLKANIESSQNLVATRSNDLRAATDNLDSIRSSNANKRLSSQIDAIPDNVADAQLAKFTNDPAARRGIIARGNQIHSASLANGVADAFDDIGKAMGQAVLEALHPMTQQIVADFAKAIDDGIGKAQSDFQKKLSAQEKTR